MGGKNLLGASSVKAPKDEDASDDDIKVAQDWNFTPWKSCWINLKISPSKIAWHKIEISHHENPLESGDLWQR